MNIKLKQSDFAKDLALVLKCLKNAEVEDLNVHRNRLQIQALH